MFISQNQVRMHDTDMAGIIFFAKQFRWVHDALEDLLSHEGFSFDRVFHDSDYIFVIVHAEADYLAPLKVGDFLNIHAKVEKIGNSSFTMAYEIYKTATQELVGTAKTVHVTLDRIARTKLPIPAPFKAVLQKHLVEIDA